MSRLCSPRTHPLSSPLSHTKPPSLAMLLLLLHSHSSRLSSRCHTPAPAPAPSVQCQGGAAVLATLQSSENSIPIKLKTGVYLFIIFLSDLKICRSDAFCCARFIRECVSVCVRARVYVCVWMGSALCSGSGSATPALAQTDRGRGLWCDSFCWPVAVFVFYIISRSLSQRNRGHNISI